MSSMMSHNYGIGVHGALGDTIVHMFRGSSVFGYIEPYKKKFPKAKIEILCCSSNPQSAKLFEENPYINSIKHIPWQKGCYQAIRAARKPGYKAAGVNSRLHAGLTWKFPKIWLNDEDEKLVKEITSHPYVLCHPFASQPGKQPMWIERYFPIIDALIDKANLRVVVVGATYSKSFKEGCPTKIEKFDYERPGLYNLVNKTNVRVPVRLALKAHGYMGSWSAFYCASVRVPIGPIVFAPASSAKTIDRVNGRRFKNRPYHLITVGANVNYDRVKRQVLDVFSGKRKPRGVK